MKELLSKAQLVTALGVVRQFPGESSHFEIDTENGSREVLVDVEIVPSGERVLCRLGFGNDGVYRIPRVGQEVAVLLPYDPSSLIKESIDFGPIIVGVLDLNAPAELDADDIVVVKTTRVHIVSDDIKLGDTANDPIVRKSDLDSFISTFNTHLHPVTTTGSPTAQAGTAAATVQQQTPLSCSPVTKSK